MENIQNVTNEIELTNHSHKTHEEETKCALQFGRCWDVQDKPAKDKKISNIPHGIFKPDMNSRSLLK